MSALDDLFIHSDSRIKEYWHKGNLPAIDKLWKGGKGGHHMHLGVKRAVIAPDADGVNCLDLANAVSNNATVPDSAGVRITADIFIWVECTKEDWDDGDFGSILGRYDPSVNESFALFIQADGEPTFKWTEDGSTNKQETAGINVDDYGIPDGQVFWLGTSLDADNEAGDAEIKFWDGGTGALPSGTPTQIGSTQMHGATTSIFAGTAKVEFGTDNNGASNTFNGRIYKGLIYADLAQTDKRLDVDFTAEDEGTVSFPATVGGTVTVNQTGATAADPAKRLVTDGVQYYRCNGVAGNVAHIDDNSSDQTTGDVVGQIFQVKPDTWRPGATDYMGGFHYYDRMCVTTAGLLSIYLFTVEDGGTFQSTASVADDDAFRSVMWKYTCATGTLEFFTSTLALSGPADAGWAKLGASVLTGWTTKLAQSGRDFCLGAIGTDGLNPYSGNLYAGWWFMDGVVINGLDFTDATITEGATTVPDSIDAGQEWTFQRSATGLVADIISQNQLQGSTDDVGLIPHHVDLGTDNEDGLWIAVFRSSLDNAYQCVAGKQAAAATANPGMFIGLSSDGKHFARVSDGTTLKSDSGADIGGDLAQYTIASQWDESESEAELIVDGVGTGSPGAGALGSSANTSDASVFGLANGAYDASGFLVGAAYAKTAGVNFTAPEWAQIIAELEADLPEGDDDGRQYGPGSYIEWGRWLTQAILQRTT